MSTMEKFDVADALKRQRERTKQAREDAAKVMFKDWERLNAEMSAAATLGRSVLFIHPEIPMDVSETETAKEFLALLEKAGFATEWKSRQQPDGETTKFLRVSWGPEAKSYP